MMRHATARKNLVEYVRGELAVEALADVEHHLGKCRECREECAKLKDVLLAMPVRSAPPSELQQEEYWQTFARRVDARLAEQRNRLAQPHAVLEGVAEYFRWHWKPALVSAGAGALVVGLLAVWFFGRRELPPVIPQERETPVVETAEREEVNDYFERSRILLIGIANIPAEDGDRVDLSVERHAARELVHTARYLEKKPIDSRSRELIRELERVLVELANIEERADVPEVDVIRTGVRQQNLLFKIRMAENQK
jgi:hypothetical protein